MVKLSTSQEAMQEICEELRQKTLEPAQEEARQIRKRAEEEAAGIVAEAEEKAAQILREAESQIDQKKAIFDSSLSQAAKQSIESVKQTLLHHLFSDEIEKTLKKEMADPELIQKILHALIHAVEKEGISTDLLGVIPKTAEKEKILALLGKKMLDRLKEGRLLLGDFAGGAEVVAEKRRLRLIMDDQSIKELFIQYLHKDFRKWIFEG